VDQRKGGAVMRIIRSVDNHGLQTFFKNPNDAIEELKDFIENAIIGKDTMEYDIVEMSEEEYSKLPEVDK
jgi:hypothetical protein